jgi:hypothetical protein
MSGSAEGKLLIDLAMSVLACLGLFFDTVLAVTLAGDCAQTQPGTIPNIIAAQRP